MKYHKKSIYLKIEGVLIKSIPNVDSKKHTQKEDLSLCCLEPK